MESTEQKQSEILDYLLNNEQLLTKMRNQIQQQITDQDTLSLKIAQLLMKLDLHGEYQEKDPKKKYKRIYIDGCFDLMHSGHFNAIRQAKELTEHLVVGVVSDEQIRLAKGPPIMTLDERVALAQACKWTDEIVVGVDYNPSIELLDQHNCSHSVHGDDIAIGPDGKDSYYYIKKADRMVLVKRTEGISTTDIVGRLLLLTKDHHFEHQNQLFKRRLSDEFEQNSEGVSSKIITEKTNDKLLPTIKLLNTTRRIKQFSNNREPNQNDKIIYVEGSWDILHKGHIQFLEKAKQMGSYLIAGIHDDETINKIKGYNYPVLNLQERTLILLAMKYVDEVIIGAPWIISQNMIQNMNISMVIEGGNTKPDFDKRVQEFGDPYQVPKTMNIYHKITDIDANLDQDQLVQRIINNRQTYLEVQLKKKMKLDKYYENETFEIKET